MGNWGGDWGAALGYGIAVRNWGAELGYDHGVTTDTSMPSQVKSRQGKARQVKSNQVKPTQAKSSQVESSQVKSSPVGFPFFSVLSCICPSSTMPTIRTCYVFPKENSTQ